MFISDFNGNGTLELNEFFMGGKAVVLATPEIAGLPYVISGLVAAGGMAAAMSTADGLILAIANAISHDVYYKMIDPKAETAKRLLVARDITCSNWFCWSNYCCNGNPRYLRFSNLGF
jgi:cation/acetate symporter